MSRPFDELVTPMLTDLYQLTMAHAYWRAGKHEEHAVFDLFFRRNPFKGEFTVFCGLSECIALLDTFRYTPEQIEYLRGAMPDCDAGFFDYLAGLTAKGVALYAVKEGSIVFPRIPLLRVEGPLAVVQLLETTLLNLVNYASLIATNAARIRKVAGPQKRLLEFGTRRAQGPDGALSASRYSYIGGFDATSNVLAGFKFGIPIAGTHAHAFVTSFASLDELKSRSLRGSDGDFVTRVTKALAVVQAAVQSPTLTAHTNVGELAAFIAYAQAFPGDFLALVDTYDTLLSGVPNFLAVAVALHQCGHQAKGIRLDSGDLAYLSQSARKLFRAADAHFGTSFATTCSIVASNDLNETTIESLNQQGHEIDAFGVGTHLVTCQAQPALGCVFKLVELSAQPRIKLSQEVAKVTLPGRKDAYRLYGQDGMALLDVLVPISSTISSDQSAPAVGTRMLCRHPILENKAVYVTPARVEPLLQCVWKDGKLVGSPVSVDEARATVKRQLATMRPDHLRLLNPTPYKVSVTESLYRFLHELWFQEKSIAELA